MQIILIYMVMKSYLNHINESNSFDYYIPDLTDKYKGKRTPEILKELKTTLNDMREKLVGNIIQFEDEPNKKHSLYEIKFRLHYSDIPNKIIKKISITLKSDVISITYGDENLKVYPIVRTVSKEDPYGKEVDWDE